MSKKKRQKRITASSSKRAVRVTHLDSEEKIGQFFDSLSPREQEAFMKDAARHIADDASSEESPLKLYVDEDIINQLTEGFMRTLGESGHKPKPGDHIRARSEDGYVVEGYVVETEMPEHSTKGKPFAMKIAIFDSDGLCVAPKDATQHPRFMLPDEAAHVQCQGMSEGLRALHVMFDEVSPDGPPVEQLFQSTFLVEPEKVEYMAQGVAYLLAHSEARPVANDLEMFDQVFKQGFTAGFQFGLYALPRGLMKLYRSIPGDRVYDLAFRFSWEHFVKEPAPDNDALMVGALDQLKAMYEEYQAVS